ncbi:hypothetical protein FKM82_024331 [Ascaphus truei]
MHTYVCVCVCAHVYLTHTHTICPLRLPLQRYQHSSALCGSLGVLGSRPLCECVLLVGGEAPSCGYYYIILLPGRIIVDGNPTPVDLDYPWERYLAFISGECACLPPHSQVPCCPLLSSPFL